MFLLAAYVVLPGALVLGPLPLRILDMTVAAVDAAAQLGVGTAVHVGRDGVEAVCNVLMFVPIGFLLMPAWARASAFRVVVVCFCGSAGVELLQGLVLNGRYASVSDVALNTAGAAIGALGACAVLRRPPWRRPSM